MPRSNQFTVGVPLAPGEAGTTVDKQGRLVMSAAVLQRIELSSNAWLKEGVMDTAEATKTELDRIATIIEKRAGCKLIKADTKSLESATRKIEGECDGHWLDLKDAARVTLAANSQAELATVVSVLKSILIHRDGFTLVKDEVTTPTSPADNKCGYSGYNYAVRFERKPVSAERPSTMPSHQLIFKGQHFSGGVASAAAALQNKANSQYMLPVRMTDAQVLAALNKPEEIPAYVGRIGEVQVNTYAMMYGKMGKKSFSDLFGTEKWDECFRNTGIDGGAGHLFYEDWRVDKESDAGKNIAALSTRYYARMRGTDPKPSSGGDGLKEEVMAYLASRPKKAAH